MNRADFLKRLAAVVLAPAVAMGLVRKGYTIEPSATEVRLWFEAPVSVELGQTVHMTIGNTTEKLRVSAIEYNPLAPRSGKGVWLSRP